MRRLSRRLFLEESLLAAAAASSGVPRVLVAAEPEKQSKSPNERLSVAVIGVRSRGGDHARAYDARDDCVISYICDADSAIGERVASRFKSNPKFVQDMRRIFDDQSVDIVSIATPNHWHALAAIWAMQAGKDVYVEKPLSHNISEGRRMVQVARKYNRICQGGTQYRSTGSNKAGAEYVRSGKLGAIKLAHVCTYRARSSIGPAGQYAPPPTVDYNLWAGPAPMELPVRRKSFHYDWHWFWDWGGGELANNSVHPVDAMRMVTGLTGLGRGALSYGGRVGLDDCGETPSVQVTIHDFGPTTVVQEVRNLKTAAPKRGATLIVGTEGYLSGGAGGTSVYDPDGKLVQKLSGPNEDHFANFIKAVRSRRREDQNADIEEGHLSTAVVHVANLSQRLGQPASPRDIQQALEGLKVNENVVETFAEIRQHLSDNGIDIEKTPLTLGPWLTIDSDRERFVRNKAANAMLTRDYRQPFVVPTANAI
jgi:predicted dehydrogenase